MSSLILPDDQLLGMARVLCAMMAADADAPPKEAQKLKLRPTTVNPQNLDLRSPRPSELKMRLAHTTSQRTLAVPFIGAFGVSDSFTSTGLTASAPHTVTSAARSSPSIVQPVPGAELLARGAPCRTHKEDPRLNSARHDGWLVSHDDYQTAQSIRTLPNDAAAQTQSSRSPSASPLYLSPPGTPDASTAAFVEHFQALQFTLGTPDIVISSSSDQDTSDDDDDSKGSHSEYSLDLTLPRLTERNSYKRVRAARRPRSSGIADSSPLSTPSPSPPAAAHRSLHSSTDDRRAAKRTSPRSLQVSPDKRNLKAVGTRCPHCDFETTQGLKRHIASHFPQPWICCGVPVSKSAQYGLTDFTSDDVVTYAGKSMVGGCMHCFSRHDGYIRHLRKGCMGDPHERWCSLEAQKPNMDELELSEWFGSSNA